VRAHPGLDFNRSCGGRNADGPGSGAMAWRPRQLGSGDEESTGWPTCGTRSTRESQGRRLRRHTTLEESRRESSTAAAMVARWRCASREEGAEASYIGKPSSRRDPGVNAMYGGWASAVAHAQGVTRRTGGQSGGRPAWRVRGLHVAKGDVPRDVALGPGVAGPPRYVCKAERRERRSGAPGALAGATSRHDVNLFHVALFERELLQNFE
jgi:hypothetical protein